MKKHNHVVAILFTDAKLTNRVGQVMKTPDGKFIPYSKGKRITAVDGKKVNPAIKNIKAAEQVVADKRGQVLYSQEYKYA